MDDVRYLIRTTMDKKTYRHFLYLATFFRNRATIPIIAAMALVGSFFVNWQLEGFHWVGIIVSWIFLFTLSIATVCFRVERKNNQRVHSDKTGSFDALNVLKFYDDRIVMNNDALSSTGELKYAQFFCIMESKDYFIFYITANQASLIRKKDVDDCERFKGFLMEKFPGKYKRMAYGV